MGILRLLHLLVALLGGAAVFVATGGPGIFVVSARLRQVGGGVAGPDLRRDSDVSSRPVDGPPRLGGLRSPDRLDHSLGRPGWSRLLPLVSRYHVEHQNRSAVIALCAATVAELRAGRQPSEALHLAGLARPAVAARAVAVAQAGGDVVRALHLDAAELPGQDGLRALAACWQVAEQHGPGLADALDRVTASLRADEAHRARISAELAGPRATVRLLAALPLVGIGMGQALDVSPLRFLIGTAWGRLVLIAGVLLELLGTWWVTRIAGRAQRRL